MTKITEIWSDGSYRQQPRTAGAGWVIQHADGQIVERQQSLPRLRDSLAYGSQIAELEAAMLALNEVSAELPVILHMDCEMALQSLRHSKLIITPKTPAPALQSAFRKAAEAVARHPSVTLMISSDRFDRHMGLAHRLSRQASAPV